jgi:hypothetical protein
MAVLQSDGVNHTSDLILRRNGTEGLRLTSSTVQLSSINDGPLAGFRNRIINGNFDFWQRGTSFSPVTGSYTTDRWVVIFNGSGSTRSISRQSFTLGQTDVPDNPKFFFRYAQSVAGTGATFNNLEQKIESVNTFAGKQVTVSFYAKAASAITLPSVIMAQTFGTGGSPSANVNTSFATNVAITTTWARYSFTATVPSISGKTLGTSGTDALIFILVLPLNSTFTLDLSQVQVEEGPVATVFEQRPIGTELALCQRYYYKSTSNDIFTKHGQGIANGNANGNFILAPTPVPLRTTPSTDYLNLATSIGSSNSTATSIITSPSTGTHVSLTVTSAGYPLGTAVFLQNNSTASGYLSFSAEL